MTDLAAYLDRIGFVGDARPDRATLDAVHRAHLLAIPYENLDVQLRRRRTPSPQAAFDKLVNEQRGGWCYEMNGTLGLALSLIGFKVTRMAGGVARAAMGDAVVGNHLVLRVDLPEGPVIADVGFGDGPLTPFDFRPGPFSSRGFDFNLEDQGDGWWRVHNHPRGGAPNFDFQPLTADEELFARQCEFLQTSETSFFTQNLFCFRHTKDGVQALRGRVLRHLTAEGTDERLLESSDDLVETLTTTFGLNVPAAATLWPGILARHEVVMAAAAAATAGT